MSYIQVKDDDVADKIIGVLWDPTNSSPTLQQIDVDGDAVVAKNTAWFNRHPLFGNIKRCTLLPGYPPVFGSNPRGDGLVLDGSVGHVMAHVPCGYWRFFKDGNLLGKLVSPVPYPGFEPHPAAFRNISLRGGAASVIYLGSYPANLDVDPAVGTERLITISGEQPMTGSTEIIKLGFNSGSVLPVKGEILTGAVSGTKGTVVKVYKASGDWGADSAVGYIYLKQATQSIPFSNGSVAITAGKTITGASSGATAVVVAITVASGSWAGGDAAGTMIIEGGNGKVFTTNENISSNDAPAGAAKVTSDGSTVAAFTNPENLNGSVGGSNIMTTTSVGSAMSFSQSDARTMAQAIGPRWGLMSVHEYELLTALIHIETRSLDCQTALGKGVCDKSWTRRFGGTENGADSINTNVAENGTGAAIGTNGLVDVSYRTLTGLWGQVWQQADGYEAVDSQFRIIRRDGLGTFRNPMQASDYEATIAAPVTDAGNDGYGKRILWEDVCKHMLLVDQVGGSSGTYLCDYHYAHRLGQTNILLVGGAWTYGVIAGLAHRNSNYAASSSTRSFGTRLSYS